ncbi:MAG TPA: 2'-deoxycytidine 5'-triphosphate deaminase [Candidatus Paceibacterota bacterium]|nr:2'-deoxycytidine 5'-triphosphate deaminase [Candidatus Paceibacterota bacterium]
MEYKGALPSQLIQKLLSGGFIEGAIMENVRPASIDLTVENEGYRVDGAFLPSNEERVEMALKRAGAIPHACGATLEKGCCYVFRLKESIVELPTGVYGYSNPKSSSGRLDIHVRLLADRVAGYDSIPNGYSGPLWMMISPKKFSVILREGITLLQLRFFNQDTRFDELRLRLNFEADGGFLMNGEGQMIRYKDQAYSHHDGSIVLTLGLCYEMPGFEAIETGVPIDLSLVNHYDPEEFFRPITVKRNSIALAVNAFYILSTREYVRVPRNLSCEMVPMDARNGELRSHYAGFIDPGWGIGIDGSGKGRPLTLEVRSFDSSLIIQNGQPIADIRFERMIEEPHAHYDQMSPHYGDQNGPKLGKHFKPWTK